MEKLNVECPNCGESLYIELVDDEVEFYSVCDNCDCDITVAVEFDEDGNYIDHFVY